MGASDGSDTVLLQLMTGPCAGNNLNKDTATGTSV